MKKTIAKIFLILLLMSLALTQAVSCSSPGNGEGDGGADTENGGANNTGRERYKYAEIVTDLGTITLKLDTESAPITVANFLSLADSGFYDGLTFHRAQEDFMIQGGDPKADGTGNSKNPIKGEFIANGVYNKISHLRGVISMARRGDSYDSASCQFFICNADSTFLDGQYAAFGEVIEGMDVVDAITDAMAPYGDYYSGTVYDKTKHVTIIEVNTITEKEAVGS